MKLVNFSKIKLSQLTRLKIGRSLSISEAIVIMRLAHDIFIIYDLKKFCYFRLYDMQGMIKMIAFRKKAKPLGSWIVSNSEYNNKLIVFISAFLSRFKKHVCFNEYGNMEFKNKERIIYGGDKMKKAGALIEIINARGFYFYGYDVSLSYYGSYNHASPFMGCRVEFNKKNVIKSILKDINVKIKREAGEKGKTALTGISNWIESLSAPKQSDLFEISKMELTK